MGNHRNHLQKSRTSSHKKAASKSKTSKPKGHQKFDVQASGASSSQGAKSPQKMGKRTSETKGPVVLNKAILQLSNADLNARVRNDFVSKYEQEPRLLQVEVVRLLARCLDTFVMAGTGYGKTRIAESFVRLFDDNDHPIVIILNPLDALGDNQVKEKINAGFTAINLTMLKFTEQVEHEIQDGKYTFLYMSPEIFVHDKRFQIIYTSRWFQDRLILKVVDEAHMIYTWGLVESKKSKKLRSFDRQSDGGKFRPSYGHLGTRLMMTSNVPLLLMSATCPPRQYNAILENLSIKPQNIETRRGELTRPEITIIHIQMKHATYKLDDLRDSFTSQAEVSDANLVPTLIYTGSRKGTQVAVKAVAKKRQTLSEEYNSRSSSVRRYHSNTGSQDKEDRIRDYSEGRFAVICCTIALGLGQNWTRVRRVIQMGRTEPCSLSQILGRCGRNGKPGLGVVYVEKSRRGGRNCIEDFDGLEVWNDDDMMDAWAITPVCLRVALTLANTKGIIPLAITDHLYLEEKERERNEGFSKCQCSNCESDKSDILIDIMKWFTKENFERYLAEPNLSPKATSGGCGTDEVDRVEAEGQANGDLDEEDRMEIEEAFDPVEVRLIDREKPPMKTSDEHLLALGQILRDVFFVHYTSIFGEDGDLAPEDYLREADVFRILQHFKLINTEDDLKWIIGGDVLIGGVQRLFEALEEWKNSPFAIQREQEMATRAQAARKSYAETFRRLERQNMAKSQARMLARERLEEKRQLEEIEAKKKMEEKENDQRQVEKAQYLREANARAIKWLIQDKIPMWVLFNWIGFVSAEGGI